MTDYILRKQWRFAGAGVRTVSVNWISGEAVIRCGESESDEILISESSRRPLREEEELYFSVNGGELKIDFVYPGSVKQSSLPGKLVEIILPKALLPLAELKLSCVSADVTCIGVDTDNARFNTVSGDVRADGLTANSISVNTVSGDAYIGGECRSELSLKTVSGDMTAEPSGLPTDLSLKSVSGDIRLILPENDGFNARWSGVSGGCSCEFNCQTEKRRLVYKGGGAEINFGTVSGELRIEKSDAIPG